MLGSIIGDIIGSRFEGHNSRIYRNGATTDINSPIKTICLVVINKNNKTCFATLNKLCIFAGKNYQYGHYKRNISYANQRRTARNQGCETL